MKELIIEESAFKVWHCRTKAIRKPSRHTMSFQRRHDVVYTLKRSHVSTVYYCQLGQIYYKVGQVLLQSRGALCYNKVKQELLQSGAGNLLQFVLGYLSEMDKV